MPDLVSTDQETVTLCEVLDRILNKGAVVVGDVTISVAGIDLLYLGLQIILTSIATAQSTMSALPENHRNAAVDCREAGRPDRDASGKDMESAHE